MKTVLMLAVIAALAAAWTVERRRGKYWQKCAIANARAKIQKDHASDVEKQQINRKAAREIVRLNAAVEDLQSEIQRQRNINRNLLRQMDKRKDTE